MTPLFEIRPGIRRLFRLAPRPADARAGMDDEIRLHLALRAEQLMRAGLSPEEARAEAERRFGSVDEARARLGDSAVRVARRARVRVWAEELGRDARLSLRRLRRAPGFVVTVVTCVALGVGANAAAFSLFDELLLRPLPVREPARLVNLASPGVRTGGTQCNRIGSCEEVFSYPTFRDLERAQRVFTGIAAHRLFLASVAYQGHAVDADGVLVSGSYFPVLGIRPALGRLLGPSDDAAAGAGQVAVLSHAYWATQLGADPDVIGREVVVNGRPLTIVGVAPRGFEGTTLGVRPRVFVPLTLAADLDIAFGPRSAFDDRLFEGIFLFARLAPGVDMARASAAMNAVYSPILDAVEAPLQRGLSDDAMRRFRARQLVLTDGRSGQSELRVSTRTPLTLLFAITALVVVIAAANIANLLLARGTGRAAEVAVRMSLGASRRRIVAQLLTESCLLAALGAAASLLVARAAMTLVASFIPAAALGTGTTLSLELRPSVVVFAAVVSLGSSLLFGLFPALHASRPDLLPSIRSGAGAVAGGHRAAARFRSTLVTAQIALSMALLASAGLLVTSLRNIGRVDLGLESEGVVTFALLPALSGYQGGRAAVVLQRVEERLAALPGVSAVGSATMPLLTGMTNGGDVRIEGVALPPGADVNVRVNSIGPGYLRALGIPLLAGRELTAADRLGAPKVALVNAAFTRKFGLGRDAVGRRIALGGRPEAAPDVEIVGVMGDAVYGDVKGAPPPLVVTPHAQAGNVAGLVYYVRSGGAASATMRSIPDVVAKVDPTLAVAMLKPLPQQVRENVYLDRLVGTLSAAFAILATLLAAVGLYGVLAYTVAQRRREIGVRMALGADPRRVRGLVLAQVGRMTAAGLAVGVVAALALGRVARSLLFGLGANDPRVVAGAAVVLAVAALAAGLGPAWRASRIPPGVALRAE